MKKIIALAMALTLCLAMIPLSVSAGMAAEEVYYAIKAPSEPVIDGVIDDIWANANVAKVEKFGSNIYPLTSTPEAHAKNPVASAEMKVMWTEDCIFVLGVVTDPTPNKEATKKGDENIDGIDIQISEMNDASGTMRDDNVGDANEYPGNGIFNININGVATGWGGVWFADNGSEKCDSAAADTDTGYIFEARIPLQTTTGYYGKTIGLEFQINDNQKGEGRTAIRQWSCSTCMAHSNTQYLGTCIFVNTAEESIAEETEPPMTFAPQITDEPETAEPTAAPTDAPATKPSESKPTATEPADEGCGSLMAAPALVLAVALAAPVALKRKKD